MLFENLYQDNFLLLLWLLLGTACRWFILDLYRLLLSLQDFKPLCRELASFSFDSNFYGRHWAAYDVPRHIWHFSKTAIEKLFEEKGIQLTAVLPMKFDSFYVSLLSEKYKTGRMNFIRAFFVGLKSNLNGKKTEQYSSHIYILKNQ
jgi:hypothetical protein